jgi:antibiotic biosynthesis monooxygenase (ABM) superfamily enzyme
MEANMIVVLVEHFFNVEGRRAFPGWIQTIGEAASRCPGFVDIRQMTRIDEPDRTFFLLSFESSTEMQTWVASAERLKLLDQMAPFRLKPHEASRWIAGESWSATNAS